MVEMPLPCHEDASAAPAFATGSTIEPAQRILLQHRLDGRSTSTLYNSHSLLLLRATIILYLVPGWTSLSHPWGESMGQNPGKFNTWLSTANRKRWHLRTSGEIRGHVTVLCHASRAMSISFRSRDSYFLIPQRSIIPSFLEDTSMIIGSTYSFQNVY